MAKKLVAVLLLLIMLFQAGYTPAAYALGPDEEGSDNTVVETVSAGAPVTDGNTDNAGSDDPDPAPAVTTAPADTGDSGADADNANANDNSDGSENGNENGQGADASAPAAVTTTMPEVTLPAPQTQPAPAPAVENNENDNDKSPAGEDNNNENAPEVKQEGEPAEGEKKADTPAEGEKKAETPADGEKKGETPADGEKKADTPADGEKKSDTPAEGEKKVETPAEGEKKVETPVDNADIKASTNAVKAEAQPEAVQVAKAATEPVNSVRSVPQVSAEDEFLSLEYFEFEYLKNKDKESNQQSDIEKIEIEVPENFRLIEAWEITKAYGNKSVIVTLATMPELAEGEVLAFYAVESGALVEEPLLDNAQAGDSIHIYFDDYTAFALIARFDGEISGEVTQQTVTVEVETADGPDTENTIKTEITVSGLLPQGGEVNVADAMKLVPGALLAYEVSVTDMNGDSFESGAAKGGSGALTVTYTSDLIREALEDGLVLEVNRVTNDENTGKPVYELVKGAVFEKDTATFTADGKSTYTINVAADKDAEASEENIPEIRLIGNMPKNAVVTIEPVSVSVDGKTSVMGFDIKIYANEKQQEKGKTWQPAGKKVQVEFVSDELDSSKQYDVYHIADGQSAELVDTVTPVDGKASIEAESFSVYTVVEHEGGEIVTPRVEFHYISPDYTENNNEGVYTYTAPGYEFLNQNNENQITQILKDGEALEQIVNPSNKKDDQGREVSFFYGWYTVEKTADTTALDRMSTARLTATIKAPLPTHGRAR